jgi:hypothetical protein
LCALTGTVGCSDDGATCVENLDSSCAPLYEPTFDNLFSRTLEMRCGVAGGACHSAEGHQAGLVFDNADDSYANLVNAGRVIPGDAACSLLVERIEGSGVPVMPPGAPMSDAERCAIETWIDNGAQR